MNENSCLFNIGIASDLNGFKLKNIEPDEAGFFPMVISCLGMPTRAKQYYQVESVLRCMRDTSSRFNVCLRDGNLHGEWGHPVITERKDMPRLFRIDEHYISHYFGRIWTGDPINIRGNSVIPVRALVKPTGPYGDMLEKLLRDPSHNTAFSLRSLCYPTTGPDASLSYLDMQMMITYDAVNAPGYEITSKRYVPQMESFSINCSMPELEQAAGKLVGMENGAMLQTEDLRRLYGSKQYRIGDQMVGCGLTKDGVVMDNGAIRSAAAVLYGRR